MRVGEQPMQYQSLLIQFIPGPNVCADILCFLEKISITLYRLKESACAAADNTLWLLSDLEFVKQVISICQRHIEIYGENSVEGDYKSTVAVNEKAIQSTCPSKITMPLPLRFNFYLFTKHPQKALNHNP